MVCRSAPAAGVSPTRASGGGAYNTAIQGRVAQFQAVRSKRLFDRLSSSSMVLTEDMIASEDFIHRFLVTHEAALRTFRHEKIDRLADLLAGSVSSGSPDKADLFEELLRLLDELSTSELIVLAAIQKIEESDPWADAVNNLEGSNFNDRSREWVKEKRAEFVTEIQRHPELQGSDVRPLLSRIESKGLVRETLRVTYTVLSDGRRDTSFDGFEEGPFAFLTGLYAQVVQAVRAGRKEVHESASSTAPPSWRQ